LPTNFLRALGFSSKKKSQFLELTLVSREVLFRPVDTLPGTSLTSASVSFEPSPGDAQKGGHSRDHSKAEVWDLTKFREAHSRLSWLPCESKFLKERCTIYNKEI
jgi:hypothetical protein